MTFDLDNFADNSADNSSKDSWMIVFADLLALLLTFFVLMFSMSSVQVSKWEAIVESLSENLNPKRAEIQEQDWQNIEAALSPQEEALSLPYLEKIFVDKLQYDPILKRSSVTLLDDRLAITLPADLIFEKGSAELSPEAYKSMQELGAALQSIQNKITVIGHTDMEPVSGRHYPSNWELSLVRALSVARLIEQVGYSHNIEVFGNGSSRFDKLDENIPLDKRYQLSRRVDIFVHREDKEQITDISAGES